MGDKVVRKGLVVGIIILFIGSNFVSGLDIQLKNTTILLITGRGNILYVGGNGSGNYSKIQDAIDNALDGDTVFVYDDSSPYYENVELDKSINLIGEDKDTTIIDGSEMGDVISIVVDWVNISGFTLQNSGDYWSDAGIKIFSNHNTIIGNTISNNNLGIFLDYSSGNIITGNIMVGDGILIQGYILEHWNTHVIDTSNTVNGKPVIYWKNQNGGTIPAGAGQVILANCTNVVVENQNITGVEDGIELGFSSSCTITGNNISNNDDGVYIYKSGGNNIIIGNNISNNYYGIDLYSSSGNNINGNTISNNYHSIHLIRSKNNIVTGNTISINNDGIYLDDSSSNIITYNTISNNEIGIYLGQLSSNNNLLGNSFFNGGLFISDFYDYTVGNTVENNTVNDKPLVYLEDESDKIITDAGQVILVNCNNITAESLNLSNTNVGIVIWRTNNSLIIKNDCSNNDDGIYLRISSSNTITGNNVISNNNYGIELYHSDGNTFKRNNISNNYDGLYVRCSSNNYIVGNNITSNKEKGINLGQSYNNTIIGNNITLNNDDGIFIGFYSLNNIIKDNEIISNSDNGIYLFSCYYSCYYENTIIGNNILNNNNGIEIFDSQNTTINGNNISSNKEEGIELDHSNNNTIIDNIVRLNNNWGICIWHSTNNIVTGNNISDNLDYGMSLGGSDNNIITGNTINMNSWNGIYLDEANSNTIKGNNISNNGGGIILINSSRNIIKMNAISNNGVGISTFWYSSKNTITDNNISLNNNYGIKMHLSSGDNNSIYHNFFIDNTQNAYDECNNTWDNDYPSGGNFWDDYNGTDCNGDGIGDTPYPIPGGDNVDSYPLGNFRPDTPMINGPTNGKPSVDYNYTFVTTDPEGDDIWYHIDWGDKEIIYIYGPYPSGEEITLSYNWSKKGTFIITCWARDIYDADSNTTTLKVTIPRTRTTSYLWYHWFFRAFPLLERLLLMLQV